MKRVCSVFLALILCTMLTVSVSAAQLPRLVDAADLLSDSQEAELLQRLDRVSQELQVDVVIVTMESMGGYTPEQVAYAYYDQNEFGYGGNRDGVLLLLSMAERDWLIFCNGFADIAITQAESDDMGEHIVDELSAGEYMEAFMEFVSLCQYEIEGELNGFPFNFGMSLGVSLAIGFAAAFIATGVMRSKLKSVRSRTGAREYTKPGSMQLTRSTDLYLYRTLDRIRKPQQSSSGSRGGGGGGRHVSSGKF